MRTEGELAGWGGVSAAETLGKIDAATLTRAHAIIESNKAKGKLVLEGF